jgi:hypothetical protein
MLAVTKMRLLPMVKGAHSSLMILSAVASAPPALETPSSKTVNSSPPMRATMSVDLKHLSRRWLTAKRSWSPTSCPKESLIILKLSRSRNSTATTSSHCRVRARASSRRSKNRARFGRPVNGSWKARCSSSSSSALRLVMSTMNPCQ